MPYCCTTGIIIFFHACTPWHGGCESSHNAGWRARSPNSSADSQHKVFSCAAWKQQQSRSSIDSKHRNIDSRSLEFSTLFKCGFISPQLRRVHRPRRPVLSIRWSGTLWADMHPLPPCNRVSCYFLPNSLRWNPGMCLWWTSTKAFTPNHHLPPLK